MVVLTREEEGEKDEKKLKTIKREELKNQLD